MHFPFPGMDPYIERPAIFPDFHDRLVTRICETLQPLLRPRYVALVRDRLYVVESERPIYPDVAIVRAAAKQPASSTSTAVAELDEPAVFELWREEIRELKIEIIEPAVGERIVTSIEVLSPSNKVAGPGRDAYLTKREEYWAGGTSLVEIDLLRDGEPTIRLSADKLATLKPWQYLVAVTRCWPSRQEVYAIGLKERLANFNIPVSAGDKDVPLDLRAVFSQCWDAGPYPTVLRYDLPPPGEMSADDAAWCRKTLSAAGFAAADK